MKGEEILPHRFPFLLVDRVVEVVPGERVVAVKRLSASDRLLRHGGHLPRVFLLEACAQLCALAGAPAGGQPAFETADAPAPKPGYLVGIEGFEILGEPGAVVQAGDTVELTIQLGRAMGKLQQVAFETRLDGAVFSRGNLTVLNP